MTSDFPFQRPPVIWSEPADTTEELSSRLRKNPTLYDRYQRLNRKWKGRLSDFLIGQKSLPLTYDPFFKFIFNPDYHQDRLSDFVSSILGIQITIVEVLSMEDTLMDGESYLIMDLVARTKDGSIINVEIQKQGYDFPGERMACYASDLLLRQYIKVKKSHGHSPHDFSYRDIKPVYVIVIFEHTTPELRLENNSYIHYGKTTFDTGMELHMPERFCIISLDVFREIPYSKLKKCTQSAWLLLLSTETLKDAERLILDYPWLEPIYQEIAALRRKPEEVFDMWSEALLRMDENTLKYQVERMQAEVDKLKQDAIIAKQDAIKSKQAAIESDAENQKLREQAKSDQARIAELERLLKESHTI